MTLHCSSADVPLITGDGTSSEAAPGLSAENQHSLDVAKHDQRSYREYGYIGGDNNCLTSSHQPHTWLITRSSDRETERRRRERERGGEKGESKERDSKIKKEIEGRERVRRLRDRACHSKSETKR